MLAKIPPMKRILCLCPVPSTSTPPFSSSPAAQERGECYDERYSIGMAMSDPYLAYAIPIQQQTTTTTYEVIVRRRNNHRNETLSLSSYQQQGFPSTLQELIDQCGYTDIGAIVLSRPLLDCTTTESYNQQQQQQQQMDENVKNVQDTVYSHWNNLILSSQKDDKGTIRKIGLQGCFKLEEEDEQQLLTLQDARKMAMEEPEMWEEIPFLDYNEYHPSGIAAPEIHAAVKLNAFLWRHTGGWRNTFA